MKNTITGLILGIAVSLTCTACSVAKDQLSIHHMKMILTDINSIFTTTIATEEGTYRIFTVESPNSNTSGITAVKIK